MSANSELFSPFSQTPETKAPNLSYSKVWSAAESIGMFVYPVAGSWAIDVATFTAKNHNFASADSVIVESNVATWNIGAVAATVTDADTFTVPLVGDPGAYPDRNAVRIYAGASPTLGTISAQTGPSGGTANGTLTKASASVNAIHETWTITSTSATNFTVTGSRSGAKGAATVGTPYDNGLIAFTLVAGTVAFHTGGATTFTLSITGGMSEWVRVTCLKYSRLMFNPKHVQTGAATGIGTFKISAKLHPSAPWFEVQAAGATAGITSFTYPYNIVRLERVAGVDAEMPVAYSQGC